jgi:hypothetical protein
LATARWGVLGFVAVAADSPLAALSGLATPGFGVPALSVTAIAVWLLASAALASGAGAFFGSGAAVFGLASAPGLDSAGRAVAAWLDFDSLFVVSLLDSARAGGEVNAGVVGAGTTGAGITVVESFFSATGLSFGDLSAGESAIVDGPGVIGLFAVAAVRAGGGGFIQSSAYGTATAPTTPRTITTRTTRNQVAAKIDLGGTSSYSSCS